jgi:hypothetical protein
MHDDIEVGVEEQDPVGADGGDVQEHGHRGALERVGEEGGLDHDEGAQDALPVEHEPEERRLVGAVVEHLVQEQQSVFKFMANTRKYLELHKGGAGATLYAFLIWA